MDLKFVELALEWVEVDFGIGRAELGLAVAGVGITKGAAIDQYVSKNDNIYSIIKKIRGHCNCLATISKVVYILKYLI